MTLNQVSSICPVGLPDSHLESAAPFVCLQGCFGSRCVIAWWDDYWRLFRNLNGPQMWLYVVRITVAFRIRTAFDLISCKQWWLSYVVSTTFKYTFKFGKIKRKGDRGDITPNAVSLLFCTVIRIAGGAHLAAYAINASQVHFTGVVLSPVQNLHQYPT